ncbi:MAG: iron-sulfur cluster assembly scaffold protein [bacterium]
MTNKEKETEIFFQNLQKYIWGNPSEPFSEKVIELAYEPVNVGDIENPDGFARIKGSCGDTIQISLKLDNDRISEIKFLSDGCAATIACGSGITVLAKNKPLEQAVQITPLNLLDFLKGLPASHTHCVELAIDTFRKALENINNKSNKGGNHD